MQLKQKKNAQTGLNLDTEKREGSIWKFWQASKNKHWQAHKFDSL